MKTMIGLGILLALASAARAGETVLTTAPLSMPGSSNFMDCQANNIDKKPHQMTVEIINTVGAAIAVAGPSQVDPGRIISARTTNIFASYCRITTDGNKRSTRGALMLGANGLPFVPQVVVPAQAR